MARQIWKISTKKNNAVYANWPSTSTQQAGFNGALSLLWFFGAATLNTKILATLPTAEMLLMPGLAFFLIACVGEDQLYESEIGKTETKGEKGG